MPPRRVSDLSPQTVRDLSEGRRESRDLVEAMAVDLAALFTGAIPDAPTPLRRRVRDAATLPYPKRMRAAADAAFDHLGEGGVNRLAAHASDTVRGWACLIVARVPGWSLPRRLDAVRPLADDTHFGVREWAWSGVRDAIAGDPDHAIRLLTPWAGETSANLRRFATEATRPRGVWARHIPLLKAEPERAEALLEPLRADPSGYVQDSVANWINDAAKTRPDWAIALCERWRRQSPGEATDRIRRRALRSLG